MAEQERSPAESQRCPRRGRPRGGVRARVQVAALRLGFLLVILALWWAAARAAPAGALRLAVGGGRGRAGGLPSRGSSARRSVQSLAIYLTGTGAGIIVGIRSAR